MGIVAGDPQNLKITTADDLARARAALAGTARVGTGYDLHRLVEHRPLVLAGVGIPSERGPFGHSDGDVVAHALIDALLGAAALGDIGGTFRIRSSAGRARPDSTCSARAVAHVRRIGWPSPTRTSPSFSNDRRRALLEAIREPLAVTCWAFDEWKT